MLDHYKELLRHFWKTVVFGALVAGGLALGMSLLFLRAMPIYEASVTLNMQPSEEELRFNSGFLGVSQFNPATIIAQTHIERLLSRKVAGRAIDILIEQSGGALPAEPPNAFRRFKAAVWRWYNILNFGYFIPQPPEETNISDLISATKVEIVEGSYVLLVSVSLDNPVLAARAANALVQAYVDQTREEFGADAARVDKTLADVIAAREDDLARYRAEQQSTAARFGINSLEQERSMLLDARAEARGALQNAEDELGLAETTIASLEASIKGASDAETVRQLRQTLAETQAARAGNEARLRYRTDRVAEADRALRDLEIAGDALAQVEQRIAETQADLEELQNRRVAARIAREAQLSQIRTIDTAPVPVYPRFPKVLINTIVGTVLGGLLVLLPVVAMDVLGNRARTSEDLRRIMGARVLPPVTRRILSEARRYRRGGKPGPALQRYADAVGQRFVADSPHHWPSTTLLVTAFGAPASVAAMRDLFGAVLQLAAPRGDDGTVPDAVELPPVARIGDWNAYKDRQIAVGLSPGAVEHDELKALGDAAGPVLYATLLP
ncbi:hypothetical protein [Paracoccus jeotgali]|uniref:hypothetical protein n=1 Tax=Paracoccus jeotgali TaxID=2065379 RepID=UPI0028ACEB94|nr:hypothetical protein [Paracoccus jeotgali]